MVKPEQSGPSAVPQPLPICTRPCSWMMRASLELKQHFEVLCSMHAPSTLCEQYEPTSRHRPAPCFIDSRPSCSLQVLSASTTMITTAMTRVHGLNASTRLSPSSSTTDPPASNDAAVAAAVAPSGTDATVTP